jgi:hypothetical protein
MRRQKGGEGGGLGSGRVKEKEGGIRMQKGEKEEDWEEGGRRGRERRRRTWKREG